MKKEKEAQCRMNAPLDKLIKQSCPNGVTYKQFNDIAEYIRGITYGKQDEITENQNGHKVLRANNIALETNSLNLDIIKKISYNVQIKESQFLKKNDILICAGSGSKEHIGKVAFVEENMNYTFGSFMGVIRTKSIILPKYMYYMLTSNYFKIYLKTTSNANSSTIHNINNSTWNNFKVPIPPIEIQKKIVTMLDKLSYNTKELIIALNKEIEYRKLQYQYYLDKFIMI